MAKRICQEIDGRFYANGLALAQFFGTTPSAITRLDQEGIISRTETSAGNLYDVGESVQGYIDKLTADSGLEDAKVRAERFKAEADIKKSKAVIAELEANELKGNMHRSEDVREITEADRDYYFRDRRFIFYKRYEIAERENKEYDSYHKRNNKAPRRDYPLAVVDRRHFKLFRGD